MVKVVGLTRIGKGRWYQIHPTGETSPVSLIWSIIPDRIRVYWLWTRYHNRQKVQDFDALLQMRKDIPSIPTNTHDSP
jgi:hypothetical protein